MSLSIIQLDRRSNKLKSFIIKLEKEIDSTSISRWLDRDNLLTLDWELMRIEIQIIRLRNTILSVFLSNLDTTISKVSSKTSSRK